MKGVVQAVKMRIDTFGRQDSSHPEPVRDFRLMTRCSTLHWLARWSVNVMIANGGKVTNRGRLLKRYR